MEICRLKDEVDALRETNALLKSYESTVQSYKKKLEDHGDLRRQLKILEDKNLEYMQQNIELEETAKKQMALKTQIEVYKKQLAHANEKLETEISKSDRLEFEIVGLNTKISVLQREKETLLSERDLLKETCEELQYGPCVKTDALADTVSKELISPATKRLMETDNKISKEEGDHAAMQVLLDESNVRIDHLRCQLREANQKILELQSLVQGNQLEVDVKLKQSDELDKDKSQRLEESFSQIVAYRQKITTLQETLSQKDAEISAADEKYRRCIEKAKQVIRSIDPKYGNYLGANANTAKMSSIEMETRIIVSAFHRLGLVCHREVLDQRFAQISQSQSFLSRQRQPICRKSIENYRNK
ncbi:protein hook-like [Ctenocephalides felis]|uniref:protein hook-like n=1 Tax=Ctenocephalides felis TaxID=7515 RepID=UPI000E6E18A7|nr:protein hook-like [Ctenocephalides felis]